MIPYTLQVHNNREYAWSVRNGSQNISKLLIEIQASENKNEKKTDQGADRCGINYELCFHLKIKNGHQLFGFESKHKELLLTHMCNSVRRLKYGIN